MLEINGIEQLRSLQGTELGSSGWHEVTQEMVDEFADVTGDHQWIHVDPERAQQTRFKGTIAHGFYTLSLAPKLMKEIVSLTGFSFALDHGLDEVRFPAPLPVGSKVRATAKILEVTDVLGGVEVRTLMTFERQGGRRPVCIAETIARFYG